MTQTITQLTLAWLIATIEETRTGLAGNLAQTPVADWGATPVREVRNHEQDLHTAMQVLGDMLNMRGAFADSGVPAAPHLEQAQPIFMGLDLSSDGLADLKKSLIDAGRNGSRMGIEFMPAPSMEATVAQVSGFTPGLPPVDLEVAWLMVRSFADDGEGGSDTSDAVVLALRGDEWDWLVAGDWRANSTLDSVFEDGGWIVGWMPYEVPCARLAAVKGA